MARALMGHLGPAKDQLLAFEVVRLRLRIAELEAEVARLQPRTTELDLNDLELHRITESAEPALA